MAHSQFVPGKTANALENARAQVNSFRNHLSAMMRSESANDVALARSMTEHLAEAEHLLEKSEATSKRIRNGARVPPRPTASVAPSVRAKRALSVLRAGLDADHAQMPGTKLDTAERDKKRKADGSADPSGRVTKKARLHTPDSSFLSAAGKPLATPLAEDALNTILRKLSTETQLSIRVLGGRGVVLECKNVFRAFIWFKETAPPSALKPANSDAQLPTLIAPEFIGCYGIDETNLGRWSCSRYAVFNVMSERANAAIRYFNAREKTGEEAFSALLHWLERHKNLYSERCEERRLAFDASRGIFLPACIYPFEGNGPPRFTRGSIPLRNNQAQPTVRVSGPSHYSQAQQQSGSRGGAASGATGTAPGAAGVNGVSGSNVRGMPSVAGSAPLHPTQGAAAEAANRSVAAATAAMAARMAQSKGRS
eukprot:GFKZ01015008.1.p1 GENE.GFKZ01015008.1~~GFKZ01015008.1.p1  ORF type:complete len:425 (+),score=41.94 GFKZ01015008.1:252-1526(+)